MRLDAWHIVIVRSGWTYRLMWRARMAAITLPWRVCFVLMEFQGNEPLRLHELVHMRQIERDGPWCFSMRYLWQLITKGYRRIDYEVEAYAVSGPISLLPEKADA